MSKDQLNQTSNITMNDIMKELLEIKKQNMETQRLISQKIESEKNNEKVNSSPSNNPKETNEDKKRIEVLESKVKLMEEILISKSQLIESLTLQLQDLKKSHDHSESRSRSTSSNIKDVQFIRNTSSVADNQTTEKKE